MDASKARRRIIIRSLGVPGGNEYGRLREPPMSWITVFITCRPSAVFMTSLVRGTPVSAGWDFSTNCTNTRTSPLASADAQGFLSPSQLAHTPATSPLSAASLTGAVPP